MIRPKFYLCPLLFVFAVLLTTCITPFTIKVLEVEQETLAVEGDIIVGGDTKIYLNMLVTPDIYYEPNFITDALVWVESTQGEKYTSTLVEEKLSEIKMVQPYFLIDTKSLSFDQQYKLCIRLPNGRAYESEFLTPLRASEIDFIEFEVNDSGTAVDFFVTAHGNSDSSPYYKWEFTEDWEFTSRHHTNIYYDPILDRIVQYPVGNPVYRCWNRARSFSILIARTDHLRENVVDRKIINTMNNRNYKISILYSMELHQMSISKEAYTYLSTLNKYSNEAGSLFAPQLDFLNGNIHCISDPGLKVIGYISAGSLSVKRIFASHQDIGIYIPPDPCPPVDLRYWKPPPTDKVLYDSGYRIVGKDLAEAVWRFWMEDFCVDCTVTGTNVKPSFWPENPL